MSGDAPAELAAPPYRALALRAPTGSPTPWHERLSRLRGAAPPGAIVQLLDARGVAGTRHLECALARGARARAGGWSRLRDPGAEFALYLAGTDQLPEALERVGVSESTSRFVLVLAPPPGEAQESELLGRLGLERDPEGALGPAPRGTFERLGCGASDLDALPPDRWELLAIEAGARVDLPGSLPSRRKG